MSRCLKFRIYEEEVLYYSCSGYPEADLCLCYRVCKKPVSHDAAHMAIRKLSLGFRSRSDTNWVVQQADWKLVISDIHV